MREENLASVLNVPLITGSVMAATVMNSLDTTIANVALPHIQGSVSASASQITWVLTSYIIAAAIMTPMTGWLAGRIGRKTLMQISIVGFTVASALCGISHTLGEIVGFRLLQGVFGAALIPMSQAILLDIHPKEKHGEAMAIWGMGAILGPILGPALGGWLTDNFSWRWVFFINVPVGMLAFFGMSLLRETKNAEKPRLDFFGFAMLALGIGALQLILDRGQELDWFSSSEIRIEAGLALLFFYLFVVQTMTGERPFIKLAMFQDRNFLFCSLFGMILGVFLFSTLAILPPMLEQLMGYPVVTTGLVTMPRGVGAMISMFMVGRLIGRVDPRILIFIGMTMAALSLSWMTGFSLQMSERLVIVSGFIQGIGTGFIFVPLTTLAFATLDPKFRNEGSAMFTLIRNIGSSAGISIISALDVRNTAIVHSRLVEGVRPDNPAVKSGMPNLDFSNTASLSALNHEITRQSMMVAYTDAFWLLLTITLCAMPMILLMRSPGKKGAAPAAAGVD